jgi:hypothetical protein
MELVIPNRVAKNSAKAINKIPVAPELIPFTSNTFFEVIIWYCFKLMRQKYLAQQAGRLSLRDNALPFCDN